MAKKKKRSKRKVVVNSAAYGKHKRSKRGTIKPAVLNDDLKASSEHLTRANVYAKLVKDALDPFRDKFQDGTMWSRLVKLFKKQIRDNGIVDFTALAEFQCHQKFALTSILNREISAAVENDVLRVEATTHADVKARWEKADRYRQILFVCVYDGKRKVHVESDTVFLPLSKSKTNKQELSFPVPKGSVTAWIGIRCDFWHDGSAAGGNSRKGMEIVTVVDLRS